ncbi:hypothetical protein [Ruminococcus sp.]|uniref:hypothetical protein n=1 Tax=Ruminococcus sp. TaxID=41978 RepID=UPI003AB7FD6D
MVEITREDYCSVTLNCEGEGVTIGYLKDWRTGDSKSAVTDVTGKVVEITREAYCSVTRKERP